MVNKRKILDRFSANYRDNDILIKGNLFEEGGRLYVVAGLTSAEVLNYPSLDKDYKELMDVACKEGTKLLFNGKEVIIGEPEIIFGKFGIKLDSLSFNYPLNRYET